MYVFSIVTTTNVNDATNKTAEDLEPVIQVCTYVITWIRMYCMLYILNYYCVFICTYC